MGERAVGALNHQADLTSVNKKQRMDEKMRGGVVREREQGSSERKAIQGRSHSATGKTKSHLVVVEAGPIKEQQVRVTARLPTRDPLEK